MNYAIMYCSKTGNTKQLADAIAQVLPTSDCIYQGSLAKEGFCADVIFLGSWTDKGTFDEEILKHLLNCEHKKIALFGTAGFGGSAQYFEAIIQKVKAQLPSSCEVLGFYMCQGKMPMGVRQRYEAMLQKDESNQKFQDFIDNFDSARTHPDDHDLLEAQKFALAMWDKVN